MRDQMELQEVVEGEDYAGKEEEEDLKGDFGKEGHNSSDHTSQFYGPDRAPFSFSVELRNVKILKMQFSPQAFEEMAVEHEKKLCHDSS